MHAVVYSSPEDVGVKEVARPEVQKGDVLVRVLSNTICGTDLRIARGLKRKGVIAPRILGHEVSGRIIELGDGVTGLRVDDRVVLSPTYTCQACAECQRGNFHLCRNARVQGHQVDGGLAEYLLVPADAVHAGVIVPISDRVDPVHASLAEPLSCVLHGQEILGVTQGDVVLVIGGGAIGLLHAQVAKLRGARTVILSEPVRFRRETALRFGADRVVDPMTEDLAAVVLEHSEGEGVDATVVCIGVPQLVNQALELTRNRGRVSLFAGFPPDSHAAVDANLVHYRELSVVGSSNSTIPDMRRAVSLIESGRIPIGELITHRYPLDDFDLGVQMIDHPEALKVAILPNAG